MVEGHASVSLVKTSVSFKMALPSWRLCFCKALSPNSIAGGRLEISTYEWRRVHSDGGASVAGCARLRKATSQGTDYTIAFRVSISSRLSLVGWETLLMREPPWESHQMVSPPWNFAGNTPMYLVICPRASELLFRLATVCGYFQSDKLKIPREPLPLFSPLTGQRSRKQKGCSPIAWFLVPKLSWTKEVEKNGLRLSVNVGDSAFSRGLGWPNFPIHKWA